VHCLHHPSLFNHETEDLALDFPSEASIRTKYICSSSIRLTIFSDDKQRVPILLLYVIH
jgi:hypothetical protein